MYLSKEKTLAQMVSFKYQIFKEEITPILHNLSQNIDIEETFKLLGQHYPNAKTRQRHYKEGKL